MLMDLFLKAKSDKLSSERNRKESESELFTLLRKKFNYSVKLKTGQLKQTHLLKKVRREIARIKFKNKKK